MRFIGKNQQSHISQVKHCACASILGILCVSPSFGETSPQLANLIRQKQQKMETLEACAKKVQGFKIAGISTLGLTAVGIGGNVALANKAKRYDAAITNVQSTITAEEKKLATLNEQIEEKKRAAEELERKKNACNLQTGKHWDDLSKTCVDDAPIITPTPVVANTTPQTTTPVVQVVDGRIVNSACIAGDLPYKASSGTYIKLAREFTIEKNGWASKKCYASSNSADVVDCSCAANACVSDEFELVQGLCKKKAEGANNEEQETPTETEQEQPAEESTVTPEETPEEKPAEKPAEQVQEKPDETLATQPAEEPKINIKLDVSKQGIGSRYTYLSSGKIYTSSNGTSDKCHVGHFGDWCIQFDDYIVNGTAACSTKYNNESNDSSMPKAKDQSIKNGDKGGQYCYCKMTSWTPNGGKTQTSNSSSWFFGGILSDWDFCSFSCMSRCTTVFENHLRQDVRTRMFNDFTK